DGARLVLDGVEEHLELVADLRRHDLVLALVVPLLDGDDPLALVADVHQDLVADDVDDAAVDDLVDLEDLAVVHEPVLDVAAGVVTAESSLQLVLQLRLGKVVLPQQITIHHAVSILVPTEKRIHLSPPAAHTAAGPPGRGKW